MSVQQSQFKPFISDDKQMAEMTPFSVILGFILAIVFGAANAYLGLCVGMTVSASVPAAVVSMGLVRFIFHRVFICFSVPETQISSYNNLSSHPLLN